MDADTERRLRQGLAALSENQPLSYQELALLGEIRALRAALTVIVGLLADSSAEETQRRLRSAMDALPKDAAAERDTYVALLAALEPVAPTGDGTASPARTGDL